MTLNKDKQEECRRLIKKYREYKSNYWKIKARNQCYQVVGNWLVGAIISIASKWGEYISKQEALSLSWDVFLKVLDNYNDSLYNENLDYYFFQHAKRLVLFTFASKSSVFLPLEELDEILGMVKEPETEAFRKMLRLAELRGVVPDKYKGIFDDSFQSMGAYRNHRKETKCPGVSTSTYFALKSVMKAIIEYELKR